MVKILLFTKQINVIQRFKVINFFIQTKSKPKWMVLKFLPVIPPGIRPIIKLQDDVLVTSDLNFLYIKIINSNNRITQLQNMGASQKFLTNEKINLQKCINNLIEKDNNNYVCYFYY